MALRILAYLLVIAVCGFASLDPAEAEDLDWKKGRLEHLAPLIGTYRLDDVLTDPAVVDTLTALLSPQELEVMRDHLGVAGPIGFIDGYLLLSGNRPHHGGEDMAWIWIRIYDAAAHVILQQGGIYHLYSRETKYEYLPLDLRRVLAAPLDVLYQPPQGLVWTPSQK